jgi:hypothetical protein
MKQPNLEANPDVAIAVMAGKLQSGYYQFCSWERLVGRPEVSFTRSGPCLTLERFPAPDEKSVFSPGRTAACLFGTGTSIPTRLQTPRYALTIPMGNFSGLVFRGVVYDLISAHQ